MNILFTINKKMVALLLLVYVGSVSSKANEIPFVVVVPSYNNAKYYERNLASIFSQQYENYRVIYIDDCSPDGTGQLVQEYIETHGYQDKMTLICNDVRCGALFNTWQAVWQCADNEVIMALDGDDWFAHEHVMQIVNAAYQKNIKMTFGQYVRFPSGQKGHSRPFPANVIARHAYREYDWISSALRTFYAGLFKSIALKDLLHEGGFFPVAWDLAYMFPMLEMANGAISHIDNELYVYNNETPDNDHKVRVLQQIHCDKVVRARKKYAPKDSIVSHQTKPTVALLMHVESAEQCSCTLAHISRTLSGYEKIHVIHRDAVEYDFVTKLFSEVSFHVYTDNFKQTVLDCVQTISQSHVVCLDDTYRNTGLIDVAFYALWMQKTQAYAFTLQPPRSSGVQRATMLLDDVIAWQLQDAAYDARTIGQWNTTMYTRDMMMRQLSHNEYNSYQELQQKLLVGYFDPMDVVLGLYENK